MTAYDPLELLTDEANDEEALATAAVRGDEEAFLRRIDMDRKKLYAIAYSYTRQHANALEAVQETVCRAWLKRRTLREPRYWTTWLVRILIRVCMDMQRKSKREVLRDHFQLETEVLNAGDPSEGLARRMIIEEALDQLNVKERMVVVLKYYRDMTLTEIAILMDKPIGSVKTWQHKALVKLRVELGQWEGDE
jgi:RNA polymerase sigma factor (sigma-70 family)